MKTLGIIGGLGPQTTSKVYLSIVDLIRGAHHKTYPPMVIYNLPFPFAIEDEIIVQGINSEKMLPYLLEATEILGKSGVNLGILPCNTLHKYIEDIRKVATFPFLSILEETAKAIAERQFKKVGILATETTVESKLYDKSLKDQGIEIIYPTDEEQIELDLLIVNLLKGEESGKEIKNLQKICDSLIEKGVEVIVLACTDLQLVMSKVHSSVPIVDTTDLLIKASVNEMLSNDKKNSAAIKIDSQHEHVVRP